MEQQAWLESRPPERLVAEGVVLQRVHVEQAMDVLAAVEESLTELSPWMPWATPGYDRDATIQWIIDSDVGWAGGTMLNYVLLHPQDETMVIGTIGFINRLRPGWLEIGYWVRTPQTGRRLARHSTARLLAAARDHMPEVDGVEIHHDEANGASGTVPAALGFTRDRVDTVAQDAPGTTGRLVVWTLDLCAPPGDA